MKYIRTKDGIYEVLEIYTYTKKKLGVIIESLGCKTQNENELKTIFFCDVLKHADTIEELCDEFVVIHKELNGNHIIHRYNWLGKSEHKMGNEVYGAIWTECGLKYVAKMNEKGELELL